jgi:hypothetical protein
MTWKLAGYVVEDLLGFGGSGEVWRGRVAQTGQPVALKRVRLEDSAQVQAARAEAALLATLDHPHLVQLHELVPAADAVVLVLDLAAGGSLGDLLRQRGRLTAGEVITALAPIGAALAYAHNEGVVHGDVSAGNVLFTDIGLPLLADLGMARIIGDDRPVRGTPAYIDPAVANGFAPGPSSDVFSLAAVAVHALCGQPLWTGKSTADMLTQASAGEIGDLDARLGDVPSGMREVLARALQLEPHLRCTAAEFALDLRHSGVPTPVEQAGGRPRVEPVPVANPVGAAGVAVHGPASTARPAFDRPGASATAAGENGVGPGQLTHGARLMARPQAHPVPPRRDRSVLSRARHSRPARNRRFRLGLLAAGLLVVLGVAVLWRGLGWTSGTADAAVGAASPSASHPSAASSAPSSAVSLAATPAGRLVDARTAEAVLVRLDALRQQAFGQGNPALLAQVYLPGPLLTQDSIDLERAVPSGCSLLGVHTTYTDVRLAPGASGRTTVIATATLMASTLMCRGAVSGVAEGSEPTTLHIELVAHNAGYLIAGQQIVS